MEELKSNKIARIEFVKQPSFNILSASIQTYNKLSFYKKADKRNNMNYFNLYQYYNNNIDSPKPDKTGKNILRLTV